MQRFRKIMVFIMVFTCVCGLLQAASYGQKQVEGYISREKVKKIAYRKFEIKDGKDVAYEVYLYSENAKKQKASLDDGSSWGGIEEGDLIVTGAFKFAYGKKGSTKLKVYNIHELYGNSEAVLDLSRPYVRTFFNKEKGISDFVTLFMPECSTNGSYYSYAIINGCMKNVVYDRDIMFGKQGTNCTSTTTQVWGEGNIGFKALGKGRYMSIMYNNASDHPYDLIIWKYDQKKNKMFYVESREGFND